MSSLDSLLSELDDYIRAMCLETAEHNDEYEHLEFEVSNDNQ